MTQRLPTIRVASENAVRRPAAPTGDRYVTFEVDQDDFDKAMAGRLTGMKVPAEVSARHLDQVLAEIRDLGGVRFVITPRSSYQCMVGVTQVEERNE